MTMLATQNRAADVPAIHYSNDQLEALEATARQYSLATTSTLGKFQAAFTLAAGMRRLRQSITDEMMEDVVTLAGTSLGFKTDRDNSDKGRYPIGAIKEAFIEATLRGARLIGNEFNVIAGRCYLTKEFYMRAFGELPGITNVTVATGVPGVISDGLCGVRVTLRWRRDGQAEELASADDKKGRAFVVKYYKALEADQVIGKALRKAFKAAYEQVTGSALIEDDDMVDGEVVTASRPAELPATPPATPPASRTAQLAQRVGASRPATPAGAASAPAAATTPAPPTEPSREPAQAEPASAEAGEYDAAMDGATVDPASVPRDATTVATFEASFMAIARAHGMDETGAGQFFAKAKLANPIVRLTVREKVLEAFANGALGADGRLPA